MLKVWKSKSLTYLLYPTQGLNPGGEEKVQQLERTVLEKKVRNGQETA